MSRRIDQYVVDRGDNLADPDFWFKRFEDIDLRLSALEVLQDRVDDALAVLTGVALQRLNDTFTPLIIEAQARVGALGSLGASFSGESQSTVTISSSGIKIFILTGPSASNYVYTDYVMIRVPTAPENFMLAHVTSYDSNTKTLTVVVENSGGSGTYSNWLIRVGTAPETGHAARTDNPHATTAAQVGAPTTAEVTSAIAAAIAALPSVDLSSRLATANFLSEFSTEIMKGAARSSLGLKQLATQDSVGYGQLASNIWATAANFRANTPTKVLQTNTVWDAANYVGLQEFADPIPVDLSQGINFSKTMQWHRTLGNPINAKPGQSGMIYLSNPSGYSLGFQNYWKFDSGVPPTIAPGNGTWLYYHVYWAQHILIGRAFYAAW